MRKILGQRYSDPDAGLAHGDGGQPDDIFQAAVDIDKYHLRGVGPGEIKDPFDYRVDFVRGQFELADNLFHQGDVLGQQRFGLAQLLQGIKIRGDAGKRVSDLMRHARGDSAQRGHLVTIQQQPFQLFGMGDIHQVDQDGLLALVDEAVGPAIEPAILLIPLAGSLGQNPDVVRLLVGAGADIQFVGELRHSLEDVYFQLVKNA